MAEVVLRFEVLQALAAREAVGHKIHAPGLADRARQLQRHLFVDRALAPLEATYSQVGLPTMADNKCSFTT